MEWQKKSKKIIYKTFIIDIRENIFFYFSGQSELKFIAILTAPANLTGCAVDNTMQGPFKE